MSRFLTGYGHKSSIIHGFEIQRIHEWPDALTDRVKENPRSSLGILCGTTKDSFGLTITRLITVFYLCKKGCPSVLSHSMGAAL
jgi:hypothetical protein